MSKFLNAILGPLGLKKTGFERIGQGSTYSNHLEMDTYGPISNHDEAEDIPDQQGFEFFCVTEFTDVPSFPAFDYDDEPQFFRHHAALCYLVDKNVLSFTMQRVAIHLQKYGFGNYGISEDLKACEIDPTVLVTRSMIPLVDYPLMLSGSVPESAISDVVTRDDSSFFRAMKKKLRHRKCYATDWEEMGIYRIPATVAVFVCMNGTPSFLTEANDKFTIDDVANYCIQEEKRAQQLKREQGRNRRPKSASRSRKSTYIYDGSDADSEEYADLRNQVYDQCKLESIMRLGSHHRWYRVPHWMLEFAQSHESEDDSTTSSMSVSTHRRKKKKANVPTSDTKPDEPPVDLL